MSEAKIQEFGRLEDGALVQSVEISNEFGLSATIITLGASIQSLLVPSKEGRISDVVLGHTDLESYVSNPQYFGASVGRYANRIASGRFSLNGKLYCLDLNDGPNHLHGGHRGFDKVVWDIDSVEESSEAKIILSYKSESGENGYPGTLTAKATFRLEKDGLHINYRAMTDQPTIVNMTNHSFFNLAGEDQNTDVLKHQLSINAGHYTPIDHDLIPTGEIKSVVDTPFDFRKAQEIGEQIRNGRHEQIALARGYDHNFVIDKKNEGLHSMAILSDPSSGRRMEVLSNAPGLQFYSGNFLDGSSQGKNGQLYRQGDGVCLEPQHFPDSPNQPNFPSSQLNPGDEYIHDIAYRFSTL